MSKYPATKVTAPLPCLRLKPKTSAIWPGDCPRTKQIITDLEQRGHQVDRHTNFQIKVRDISFYLTTGTIMIDPHHVIKGRRGLTALFEVLDERHPKQASIKLTL
jgi:hypothetical protein